MALTAKTLNLSPGVNLALSGNIDEHTNFSEVFKGISGQLTIDCSEVKKINSSGVKSWIMFFQEYTKTNHVKFVKMAIPLVEQLNSVMNFACKAEVESVMVPFVCTECKKESSHCMDTAYLKGMTSVADAPCPHCSGTAEFDDLPEEYFSFLEFN